MDPGRDNEDATNQRRPQSEPLTPEVIEPGTRDYGPGWGSVPPFGDRDGIGGKWFGPRTFRGGQIQVYGCSPGCLILSIAFSVIASILLTLLLNAIL